MPKEPLCHVEFTSTQTFPDSSTETLSSPCVIVSKLKTLNHTARRPIAIGQNYQLCPARSESHHLQRQLAPQDPDQESRQTLCGGFLKRLIEFQTEDNIIPRSSSSSIFSFKRVRRQAHYNSQRISRLGSSISIEFCFLPDAFPYFQAK